MTVYTVKCGINMSCIITNFVTAKSGSCPVGLVEPSELQLGSPCRIGPQKQGMADQSHDGAGTS